MSFLQVHLQGPHITYSTVKQPADAKVNEYDKLKGLESIPLPQPQKLVWQRLEPATRQQRGSLQALGRSLQMGCLQQGLLELLLLSPRLQAGPPQLWR